ncbi:MAG: hypothetical protein Q9222_005553 [Ikaeria aurantiellina]
MAPIVLLLDDRITTVLSDSVNSRRLIDAAEVGLGVVRYAPEVYGLGPKEIPLDYATVHHGFVGAAKAFNHPEYQFVDCLSESLVSLFNDFLRWGYEEIDVAFLEMRTKCDHQRIKVDQLKKRREVALEEIDLQMKVPIDCLGFEEACGGEHARELVDEGYSRADHGLPTQHGGGGKHKPFMKRMQQRYLKPNPPDNL